MAMAYSQMGDNDSAKDHLVELLRIDPADVGGLVALARIYGENEKDYVAGERFARRAVEAAPDDAWALNSLGANAVSHGSPGRGHSLIPGGHRRQSFQLAQELWRCWQAKYPKLGAGGVYELIDDFGEMSGRGLTYRPLRNQRQHFQEMPAGARVHRSAKGGLLPRPPTPGRNGVAPARPSYLKSLNSL